MSGLPKKLRIGPFDYEVEDWDSRLATSAERLGECDRVQAIIRVRTDMPAQRIAETLWHEVLHAGWDTSCCDDMSEETAIGAMSMIQCQIMRDNPALLAFMQKSLGKQ